VPLLALVDDLRRHDRGAAQHHRAPAARAGRRGMIDAAERASMEDSVRAALAAADGRAAVDRVLGELGWLDLLEAQPDEGTESGFGALGAANAAGTALADVLAAAVGEKPRPDLAVLLPPFAAWDPPGVLGGGTLRAAGLASGRAAAARELLVLCGPA